MKNVLTLILLLTLSVFGVSFDCAKAKTNVEKMICSDPELSLLDENLSQVFNKALKISKYKNALKTQQLMWLKERNKCDDDIDCVINSYRDRLSVFKHSYKLYEKPLVPLSKAPYTLIINQDDNLCKPLLELYNQDIEKVQKINYGRHREFNWLQWKDYIKRSDNNDMKYIGGAFFDLNGDGNDEFVFGRYGSIHYFSTEDYMVFDSNVSDFFRHAPNFIDKWPHVVFSFDNLGYSEPKSIGGIDYELLLSGLNQLPPYMAKTIIKEKHNEEEWKRQNPTQFVKIGWIPIWQKNEIRFLKWQDGRIYIVFEGSQRFRDRNQFNLVGKINQNYSFDTQCLFYKKNK